MGSWDGAKQQWCCRIHHVCGQPTQAPAPADPYNCQDGFANWQVGWSVAKKEWCCRMHGKGCPNQGGGCVGGAVGAPSEPYDLRRWICQLDGRLERRQEGLVLFEQGQGLPTSSWRMCLSELEVRIHPGSGAGALRHLRVPLTGAVWTAVAWYSPVLAFAPSSGSGASMLVPSVLLE